MTFRVEGLTGDGEFWALDNPEDHTRGTLAAEDGQRAEVTLAGGIKPDPRVRPLGGGLAWDPSPEKAVEAFRATTLQGRLDSGQVFSLLDAHNHGGDGQMIPALYRSHQVVVGALVGPDQRYRALKFRFDDPIWLAHLEDGESSTVEDDGSILRVEASEQGNWLIYESAQPFTLREIRSRAETSCITLARLVLDRKVSTGAKQALVDPDGVWVTVLGSGRHSASGVGASDGPLLPPEELTLERFAKWVALADQLDGLASAVVEPLTGVLQVQAQVATSLIEGIHRRLPGYPQFQIDPEANKKPLERIRKKAKDAAGIQAEEDQLDKALVRKLVGQSLSHFEQISFAERATDIVTAVSDAVPEIVESLIDLTVQLKHARNEMAHQLQVDEVKEPLLQRYPRYLVVITITPWLLRGLLLLHAGIDPDRLHDGYVDHEEFAFARAHVSDYVSELGWERPAPQSCPRCATRMARTSVR